MKISRTHKPEDLSLEEWQRILRKQYGEQQKYKLDNTGNHPLFSEFKLTNSESGKVYKIAIRGDAPGDNYCSCPDYSINNLGTCKHIEFTLSRLMEKKGAKKALREGYTPPYSEVYLRYGLKRDVRFKAGKDASPEVLSLVNKYFDPNGMLKEDYILHFHQFLNNISQKNGHEIRCYDDVMAHIAEYQDAEHRRNIIKSQLKGGINSPIVKNILKTKLYPYQREGALFAVNAGRCLIGDDMGLGKTIQALAAAELMAKLFNIQKVLIVSPTSLKHQWKTEIEKFTDGSVQVIEGLNHLRRQFYRNESFYKLINYELVFRDIDMIKGWAPDLIILDEAQRIKNWKTRTAQYVKQLNSTFAIVLTGTPIENRIEELHSIMEFIDRRHFGPLYRFVHNHRIVDEGGKVIGYQNLQSIRDSLKNVMMRRKKEEVLKQLPERIDKNFFVPMPKEQRAIHDENYDIVAKLVAKWRRYKFLCEADQRRLQIALNYMRMAADNTYLVDKKTIHGPKIEELEIILKEIIIEGGEKAVIFSQWLRMTELVEHVLKRNGIGYVHLNGNIPSKQRAGLMSQFMENPECKVFLSTDAGGVGLNLQSGSTVINMDIPWNPAVLEQRIGRVHRLGQQKTVRVINFVTVSSIEERMLDLLKFKKSLFAGTLDSDGENVVMIGESQLKKFMQSVETLTDNLEKVDSALERQDQRETELDEEAADIKELTLEEGGHAVSAADGDRKGLDHLNNLLNSGAQFLMNLSKVITQPDQSIEKHLDTAISRDEKTGKAYLKIPLPETEVVKTLFSTLGELISNTLQMKN
ncbi:MAG: DEAD/DEAH box helicase [Candidatus Brocadia sinica]|nr:DEAD/DEAH box helicase [Candidatus Brocadia sinica]NUO04671.1 DEAD/DEAH box helicase [Candidatus Brocadia sinica]